MFGRHQTAGIFAIAGLSGFAGLAYESVWSYALSTALGHEIVAVYAVIAAFFVGMLLGARFTYTRILGTRVPALWYVVLEITIGLWALALIGLLPLVNATLPALIGPAPSVVAQWGLSFGATLVLLLPASFAMGATLPALERMCRQAGEAERVIGGVYAANTAGAVVGVLCMTFFIAPLMGYHLALLICAGVNFACAFWAWRYAQMQKSSSALPIPQAPLATSQPARQHLPLGLLLFATGLLGLAYEVLVLRVLSQVLEDTVYTFAVVLAIYLLGTSVGAAFYQRWGRDWPQERLVNGLFLLTSAAALCGLLLLYAASDVYGWVQGVTGAGSLGAMLGDVVLAALVFLLPTIAMGALFAALAQEAVARNMLGHGLAWNYCGAAVAPIAAGVGLFPAVGAKAALLIVVVGYAALVLVRTNGIRYALPAAAAALIVALVAPPLRFVDLPADGRLVAYDDGVMASVAVVADAGDTRYLKVNNHFTMGSTSSRFADHRQMHLPLLLHPVPENVLVLGVGTGMSLSATHHHPDMRVTAVELVPEVLETLDLFGTSATENDNQPRLIAADARRFVLSSEERYDVIVADLFHPSRDGAGTLYTAEHFGAISARLNDEGLFCQWLPLFQMDVETFKLIARTFLAVFPEVQVYLPSFSVSQPVVGLVGAKRETAMMAGWLEQRVPWPRLQQELVGLRMNSDFALYGGWLGGRGALEGFVGDGPLNTDVHPRVMFEAPAFAYEQAEAETNHGRRLMEVVQSLTELRQAPASAPERFSERLEDYWLARDAYLAAGASLPTDLDPAQLLEQVGPELLRVATLSADFLPAYFPLLAMAESLAGREPDRVRRLLTEMDARIPERPEAGMLLKRLRL